MSGLFLGWISLVICIQVQVSTACSRSFEQTCQNCKLGSSCSWQDTRTWMTHVADCFSGCNVTAGCHMGVFQYYSDNGLCWLTDCTEVALDPTHSTKRHTCVDDCPDFYLEKITSYTGTCAITFSMSGVASLEYCVSVCLDTPNCRGVTFNVNTNNCDFFNCTATGGSLNVDLTHMNIHCQSLCDRQYEQTCHDCRYASTCQNDIKTYTWKERPDLCRDLCATGVPPPSNNANINQTNSNITQSNSTITQYNYCNMGSYEFYSSEGYCRTLECTDVMVSHRAVTYRYSCSSDCPQYRLREYYDVSPNCTGYRLNADGSFALFKEHCVRRCLDMDGCRAALYIAATQQCFYYNCDASWGLIPDPGKMFVNRDCSYTPANRTHWQTCLNCDISDSCQHGLDSFTWIRKATSCYIKCVAMDYCVLTSYTPYSGYGQCQMTHCSDVTYRYGITSYRLTPTTDCTDFWLDRRMDTQGNCTGYTFSEDEGYPLTLDFCISKCLDTTGCRGVTYNHSQSTCTYHDCADSIGWGLAPGNTFIGRVCDTPCVRQYKQKCINCGKNANCQRRLGSSGYRPRGEECDKMCSNNGDCLATTFDPSEGHGMCEFNICTDLQLDAKMTSYRRSCAANCSEFELIRKSNHVGNSSCIIGEPLLNMPMDSYCLNTCLDTEGCLAMTYYKDFDECLLHSCLGSNVDLSWNVTHVERNCDIPADCNRTYTQTCYGCYIGPRCPTTGLLPIVYSATLDYMCNNYSQWQNSEIVVGLYTRSQSSCSYYVCNQIRPGFYANTAFRKSCVPDCPVFELKVSSNKYCTATIIGSTKPYRSYPDYTYCVDECLDMLGCRGIIHDKVLDSCQYVGNYSDSDIVQNTRYVFVQRLCRTEGPPPRLNMQTCHNCATGPHCQKEFLGGANVYLNHHCRLYDCQNISDCYQVAFAISNTCAVKQCYQTQQSIGGTVYRKTNTSSCLEFELFEHLDEWGDCPTIDTTEGAFGQWHCMDICLERDDCRAITYNNSRCYFHGDCNATNPATDAVFVRRECWSEHPPCTKSYIQQCVNCAAGPHCQGGMAGYPEYQYFTKPKDIHTTIIETEPDVLQIWWDPHNNKVHFIQCSFVQMKIGATVWRKSCSNDCLHFKLFEHAESTGSADCNIIATKAGGMSVSYCTDLCLDTDGCLGVAWNETMRSCELYDCSNYTYGFNSTFVRRECFDPTQECTPNTIQTCVGCGLGPDCQNQYLTRDDQYNVTNCEDIRTDYNGSTAVWYDRKWSQCKPNQCTQIRRQTGYYVYRESCNPECPKYEIFVAHLHYSNCTEFAMEEGGLSEAYCLHQCVDMAGCLSTTFNSTRKSCTYHNCSDTAYDGIHSDAVAFRRRCLGPDPPRSFLQTCMNCRPVGYCQTDVNPHFYTPVWQQCFAAYNTTLFPPLVSYDRKTGRCEMVDCTFVSTDITQMTLRRTNSTDCPHYYIYKMRYHDGVCPHIGEVEYGAVNLRYCIDKCLDMDGCRGVTYSKYIPRKCWFHSCSNYTFHGNKERYFVKRECIDDPQAELEVPRPYKQICHNCANLKCEDTSNIKNQTGIPIYTDCDTTCAECNNVFYSAPSMTCKQRQCDFVEPYYGNWSSKIGGSYVIRKSPDPDCPEFEVKSYAFLKPACSPYYVTEPLNVGNDMPWCTAKCLDTTGCRAVAMIRIMQNVGACHFYNCSDSALIDNWNTAKLVLRKCLTCGNETMQTCENCMQGKDCPGQYLPTAILTTPDVCASQCLADMSCTGALTSEDECAKYNCSQPQQKYLSTFTRQTCNNNDCPRYEMYVRQGWYGTCSLLPNSTDHDVFAPQICFERCLDKPGCRAVTHMFSFQYMRYICTYHDCDCSLRTQMFSQHYTFMWRYCLNATSLPTDLDTLLDAVISMTTSTTTAFPATTVPANATGNVTAIATGNVTANATGNVTANAAGWSLISQVYVPTVEDVYPKATPNLTCFPVPTTTTTVLPTTTKPSSNVTPIYIMACQCSSGLFANMTIDEIIMFLLVNLTLDPSTTDKRYREENSIYDDRPSAVTLGSVGVAVILVVSVGVILLDTPKFIKMTRRLIREIIRKIRKFRSMPSNIQRTESLRRMSTCLMEESESSPVDPDPNGSAGNPGTPGSPKPGDPPGSPGPSAPPESQNPDASSEPSKPTDLNNPSSKRKAPSTSKGTDAKPPPNKNDSRPSRPTAPSPSKMLKHRSKSKKSKAPPSK